MGLNGAKGNTSILIIGFIFQIFGKDLDLAGTGTSEGGEEEMRDFVNDRAGEKNKTPDNNGGVLTAAKTMDETAEIGGHFFFSKKKNGET